MAKSIEPTITIESTSTPSSLDTSEYLGGLFNRKSNKTWLLNHRHANNDDNVSGTNDDDQCGHIVTTYLLPSMMHLLAYLIGFIYFRINESEQLYALMEKVFLAVNQTHKTFSQDLVIKRLK